MDVPKRDCPQCRRSISNSNFLKHVRVCTGKVPFSNYLIDVKELRCIPCGKTFKLLNALKNHYIYAHTEKGAVIKKKMLQGLRNKGAWNKGKSSVTHPELERQLKAGGEGYRRKKIAGLIQTNPLSEEYKTKKSIEKKLFFKNNPEKHPNRILAGNRNKMSYPEKLVYDFLVSKGIVFEHQRRVLSFYPDFIIDSRIVEIDGEQWHTDPIKDIKRDALLLKEGYTVYRFKVKPIDTLISRVNIFLFGSDK